ncbi:MAG: hypothetical protein K2G19_01280 [Lachnospiraceae bacterium]|nr:hypothetical protein [Lachnospiraceae bacterium]
MALEGSIALPLFLFFMATILLSIEAVRFQSDVQEALHQVGNRNAAVGFLVKYGDGQKNNAKEQIREYLESQIYPYLCVEGGNKGIYVQDFSWIEENGQIEISVEYKLRPFVRFLPIGEIRVQDRFLGHAWTGYCENLKDNEHVQEVYVYITKTGTRYHMQYNCTYLKVQTQAVSYGQIASLRNQSGGKYYSCQRCKPGKGGLVYITSEGSSYHGKSDCSALKRTVYMIPLSEAEGYGACSKCAG